MLRHSLSFVWERVTELTSLVFRSVCGLLSRSPFGRLDTLLRSLNLTSIRSRSFILIAVPGKDNLAVQLLPTGRMESSVSKMAKHFWQELSRSYWASTAAVSTRIQISESC